MFYCCSFMELNNKMVNVMDDIVDLVKRSLIVDEVVFEE